MQILTFPFQFLQFPRGTNLPLEATTCHRALFCSAIFWLITNLIKWLLTRLQQWSEEQKAQSRKERKVTNAALRCIVSSQKKEKKGEKIEKKEKKNKIAVKAQQALACSQQFTLDIL